MTSLYAAFNPASGEVVARHERHTAMEFLTFLRVLVRRYRRRGPHVILDNSSTHSTRDVQAWLAAHPRVRFHFTPTGASWLTLVEVWFSILTRKSVRRGSVDNITTLVTHIRRYIATWSDHPTGFLWTREPADLIRNTVRRQQLT